MPDFLLTLLSLSLSASLIGAGLLLLRPLLRGRLSRAWQYYAWLVVVVRLVLPFAPEANLMGRVFRPAPAASGSTASAPSAPAADDAVRLAAPAGEVWQEAGEPGPDSGPPAGPSGNVLGFLRENLLTAWFVVALALFVRKATSYLSFVRYSKAGRRQVSDPQVLDVYATACADLGIRRPLPLYENKLASSPMLVGILRPAIVLPELRGDGEGLELVLRHELVHHRRRDILYKWLVQLVLCIHWFNPLLYYLRGQINRDCELACDEAVMKLLSAEEKRRYGDTLLATAQTVGGYGDAVASVTLTEDGKNLKERLEAILVSKSKSPWARLAAAALSVGLLCGAAYAGAYAAAGPAEAGGMVTEEKAPLIILPQNEYVFLLEADRGATISTAFHASGAKSALYLSAEGSGKIDLTIRENGGKEVKKREGLDVMSLGRPILFTTEADKIYSVEVRSPADGPDKVRVYGADLISTGDGGYRMPLIPSLVGDITSGVLSGIGDGIAAGILSGIEGGMEAWANDFGDKIGNGWGAELEKWAGQFDGMNNESWRRLNYEYEDGCLVGLGVRYGDSLGDYKRTIAVQLGGKSHTVAFVNDYAAFADDPKVLEIVKELLEEILEQGSGDTGSSATHYTVRSVHKGTPQALLPGLYDSRSFIEFTCVVDECQDLDTIEALLDRAATDGEEIYFTLLADELPDNYQMAKAARYAEQAAEDGHVVILSALEPYLPAKEYEAYLQKCLGIDERGYPMK